MQAWLQHDSRLSLEGYSLQELIWDKSWERLIRPIVRGVNLFKDSNLCSVRCDTTAERFGQILLLFKTSGTRKLQPRVPGRDFWMRISVLRFQVPGQLWYHHQELHCIVKPSKFNDQSYQFIARCIFGNFPRLLFPRHLQLLPRFGNGLYASFKRHNSLWQHIPRIWTPPSVTDRLQSLNTHLALQTHPSLSKSHIAQNLQYAPIDNKVELTHMNLQPFKKWKRIHHSLNPLDWQLQRTHTSINHSFPERWYWNNYVTCLPLVFSSPEKIRVRIHSKHVHCARELAWKSVLAAPE